MMHFFQQKNLTLGFRGLSSCVVEKYNGYNIEFNKKLRQTFSPIDIIYKPVKRPDEIINLF